MSGYGVYKMDRASKIFTISEYNRTHIIDTYKTDPEKIVTKRVNFISEGSGDNGDDLDYEYILGVGRLIEMKGFDITLKAFKQFNLTYPDVHYVIAGSGGKMDDLVWLVDFLDLNDKVHFTGHVSNSKVVDLIQGASFSILSSIVSSNGDLEGIPTFFMESMAHGIPCIGTDYSGIPELIDGVNGKLTGANDVLSVINAMHELYAELLIDDTLISDACYAKINTDFDNTRNTEIMFDNLMELMDDNIR